MKRHSIFAKNGLGHLYEIIYIKKKCPKSQIYAHFMCPKCPKLKNGQKMGGFLIKWANFGRLKGSDYDKAKGIQKNQM